MIKAERINQKIIATALLFLIAFALRLWYVESTEFIDPIRADAQKYFTVALNLYFNGVYSWHTGVSPVPTASVMPGYPFFILANFYFFPSLNSAFNFILSMQALLGAVTVCLCFAMALRLLPFFWALAFGMIMALLPHHVVFSGYILTETLFTFLFVFSIYSLVRACEAGRLVWWLLAALLAGLAVLTRPAALLFIPVVLFVLVFFRFATLRQAALALLVLVLTLLPWQLWSSKEQKKFPESTSFAAASLAFGSYPDFIYKTPEMRGYPYREDAEYDYMSQSAGKALAVIARRAADAPWRYLHWYVLGKPAAYWSWSMMESVGGPYIYEVGHNFWQDTAAGRVGLALSRAIHPLLVVAGILTILVALLLAALRKKTMVSRENLPVFLLASLTVIYFTGVHVVLAAWPRYAVPFWPFIYLLGMVGLHQGLHFLLALRAKEKAK